MCVTPTILFLTELSLMTKSGSFMIIINGLVNGLIGMSPQPLSKAKMASEKDFGDSLVVYNQSYPRQLFGNQSEHNCRDSLQSTW